MMKSVVRILSLLLILVLPFSCLADTMLFFPISLVSIEDEAFMGDASIEYVYLPAGTESVGERAFMNCGSLAIVDIEGDAVIGDSAFAGCGPSLLIRTTPGSPAHAYALANRLDYQAETRYRALLIANYDYAGDEYDLDGPRYDVQDMSTCLTGLSGTPWEITVCSNLSAKAIPTAISSTFADATANDVSLVYYSGHGYFLSGYGSCLVGTDNGACFADNLKNALNKVPGRKIVIIDACNSGGLLTGETVQTADSAEGEEPAEDASSPASFVSGMIAPFATHSRGGNLTGSEYYVMVAAAANESSWEFPYDDRSYGVFTGNLLTGIGYVVPGYYWTAPPADTDGDMAISFTEAFVYARDHALADTSDPALADYVEPQNAACYPANCTWFAPFRYR